MSKILIIVGLVLAAATIAAKVFQPNYQQYEMQNHTFCVPNHYLVDTSLYWWIQQIPGLDEERTSILYHFNGSEIAKEVEGFITHNGEVEQFVSGLISYLTEFEINRAKTEHPWGDLWNAEKGYEGRSVEYHQRSGLYKVYEFENKQTWYLFSMAPNEKTPVPINRYDFVVAGCQELSSPTREGVAIHDRTPTSCTGYLLEGDLDISYSFSMDNVHLLPEIREYVQSKLNEWRKCAS